MPTRPRPCPCISSSSAHPDVVGGVVHSLVPHSLLTVLGNSSVLQFLRWVWLHPSLGVCCKTGEAILCGLTAPVSHPRGGGLQDCLPSTPTESKSSAVENLWAESCRASASCLQLRHLSRPPQPSAFLQALAQMLLPQTNFPDLVGSAPYRLLPSRGFLGS